MGGSGKSTGATTLIEACTHRGVDPAIFLCDKDHLELLNIYGSKVKVFDIRKDNNSDFINSLAVKNEVIIIDTPAAFIDELFDIFSDMTTLLSAFEMHDVMPVFMIPLASDKCILSINRMGEILEGVTGEYRIIYLINEGLMTNKDALLNAFANCDIAQNEIKSGRASVVRITTKFTPAFAKIVKTQKLREFIIKSVPPMEKVLAHDLLRKTDDQFGEVLSLPFLDNRTVLEKHFAPEIEKAKASKK